MQTGLNMCKHFLELHKCRHQYLRLCTHKSTVLLQIWASVVLSILTIMHTQKYSSASDLSFCGSINTYDYAHTKVQFCFRFELLWFYQYLRLCTHKSTDLSFLGCSCVAFYQWGQRKIALWCNVRSCHTRFKTLQTSSKWLLAAIFL